MITKELEALCEKEKKMHEYSPSFKGTTAIRIACGVLGDDEVVHGRPGDFTIREGDL
jgi:methionine aminopeptidase